MRRLGVAVCSMLWILCLYPAPPALADRKAGDKGAVVATVDGVAITDQDLEIQGQLRQLDQQAYEIRQQALERVISRRLLEKAAAVRKLTVETFLKQEVEDKIAPPSADAVEAFYLARRDEFQKPFEQVRDQLVGALKSIKTREAQRALVAKLREQSSVAINLERPRFTVNMDGAPRRGSPAAPVVIVEFSDYQCPYCQKAQSTLRQILDKYRERVSLVFKDLPLTQIHGEAQAAAEASRCAGEQGKFWQYHDALFAENVLGKDLYPQMAQRLGLDAVAFQKCVESRKYEPQVRADMREGFALGANSTPTFFVNGILMPGAQPAEALSQVIDAELAASKRRETGSQ